MTFLHDSNTKCFTGWEAFAFTWMEEIFDSAPASSSIGAGKLRCSGEATQRTHSHYQICVSRPKSVQKIYVLLLLEKLKKYYKIRNFLNIYRLKSNLAFALPRHECVPPFATCHWWKNIAEENICEENVN